MSEFQPPDGPTAEELAELANTMPPTLEEAYAEGRKDEREYLLGRMEATMQVCGVSEANRFYMLTRIKEL